MKLLSFLFNKPATVAVAKKDLAALVDPFLPKGAKADDNKAIAHGWSETAEWLRIGFDCESEKGSLYHALHFSLRMVAQTVASAPANAENIEVKKDYLEAIKASYAQFTQASRYLDSMSRIKANTPPTIVTDRKGNQLLVPPIQIYNRPHAAHDLMGMKLEEIQENFDHFFDDHAVKPASGIKLESYRPVKR